MLFLGPGSQIQEKMEEMAFVILKKKAVYSHGWIFKTAFDMFECVNVKQFYFSIMIIKIYRLVFQQSGSKRCPGKEARYSQLQRAFRGPQSFGFHNRALGGDGEAKSPRGACICLSLYSPAWCRANCRAAGTASAWRNVPASSSRDSEWWQTDVVRERVDAGSELRTHSLSLLTAAQTSGAPESK